MYIYIYIYIYIFSAQNALESQVEILLTEL
jgi:hypothetical protein